MLALKPNDFKQTTVGFRRGEKLYGMGYFSLRASSPGRYGDGAEKEGELAFAS